MLGRTHLASAIFISSLFFSNYLFDTQTNVFLFVFFILGALFPDIDSSHSILGRKVKLIPFLFKHRGFFHSFWALIMFMLLFYGLFSLDVALVFSAGFVLHLILDAITKEGIALFGFKIKGPIRVGSLLEHIIYLILLVLSLLILV